MADGPRVRWLGRLRLAAEATWLPHYAMAVKSHPPPWVIPTLGPGTAKRPGETIPKCQLVGSVSWPSVALQLSMGQPPQAATTCVPDCAKDDRARATTDRP